MVAKTIVKCTVSSKKESRNYDPKNPIATCIELDVPYDTTSIFYQMSGGTKMTLNTVNQDAADMFVIGKEYMLSIEPVDEKI